MLYPLSYGGGDHGRLSADGDLPIVEADHKEAADTLCTSAEMWWQRGHVRALLDVWPQPTR